MRQGSMTSGESFSLGRPYSLDLGGIGHGSWIGHNSWMSVVKADGTMPLFVEDRVSLEKVSNDSIEQKYAKTNH